MNPDPLGPQVIVPGKLRICNGIQVPTPIEHRHYRATILHYIVGGLNRRIYAADTIFQKNRRRRLEAARTFAIDCHALRRDKRYFGGLPWFCHGPISRGHHPAPQAAVFKAVSYMDAIRGLAMTGRKRAGGEKKATTVVANHPDDLKGVLKQIGGSRSDHWNHVLASQAIKTLWLKHSDKESCDQQYSATVAALIGIGPRDELEAMIAAQLLAAHNAAMECYRRAMLFEQTFEGRRENLSQANKLSRTYAALLDALNRHRGKGQQKVTVEHVHVNAGGQAIVGAVHPSEATKERSEERTDALRGITHAPDTALRCSDPERVSLPIASGARKTPL